MAAAASSSSTTQNPPPALESTPTASQDRPTTSQNPPTASENPVEHRGGRPEEDGGMQTDRRAVVQELLGRVEHLAGRVHVLEGGQDGEERQAEEGKRVEELPTHAPTTETAVEPTTSPTAIHETLLARLEHLAARVFVLEGGGRHRPEEKRLQPRSETPRRNSPPLPPAPASHEGMVNILLPERPVRNHSPTPLGSTTFSPPSGAPPRLPPAPQRAYSIRSHPDPRRASLAEGVDWIVPSEKTRRSGGRSTVEDRLQPTLETARREHLKFKAQEFREGMLLNGAIGLQTVVGALVTGIAAITTGRRTSISTSILGGLSTLISGYLARARGRREPETSARRARDLETFIRGLEAFLLDKGHEKEGLDEKIDAYRRELEILVKKSADQAASEAV